MTRPEGARNWPCVDINDAIGFAEMTAVLSGARGCRNLLHVGFAEDGTFVGPRRKQGFELGLDVARRALKLPMGEPVELKLPYGIAAADAVQALLGTLRDHPDIDGVVADCDHFAAYSLRAAGQRPTKKSRTPVTVAGCDDNALRRAADTPWLSLATPYLDVAETLVTTLQAAMSTELTQEQQTSTTRLVPQIVGLTEHDRQWAAAHRDLEFRTLTPIGAQDR